MTYGTKDIKIKPSETRCANLCKNKPTIQQKNKLIFLLKKNLLFDVIKKLLI